MWGDDKVCAQDISKRCDDLMHDWYKSHLSEMPEPPRVSSIPALRFRLCGVMEIPPLRGGWLEFLRICNPQKLEYKDLQSDVKVLSYG